MNIGKFIKKNKNILFIILLAIVIIYYFKNNKNEYIGNEKNIIDDTKKIIDDLTTNINDYRDNKNLMIYDTNKKKGFFFYLYPTFSIINNYLYVITFNNPTIDKVFYREDSILKTSNSVMKQTFSKQEKLIDFYVDPNKKYFLIRNFKAYRSSRRGQYSLDGTYSTTVDITTYINQIENLMYTPINNLNMSDRIKCITSVDRNNKTISFSIIDNRITGIINVLDGRINNKSININNFIDHSDNKGLFIGMNNNLNLILVTSKSLTYELTTTLNKNNITQIKSNTGVNSIWYGNIIQEKQLNLKYDNGKPSREDIDRASAGKYTFSIKNNDIYFNREYKIQGYDSNRESYSNNYGNSKGYFIRSIKITDQINKINSDLQKTKPNSTATYVVNPDGTTNKIVFTLNF